MTPFDSLIQSIQEDALSDRSLFSSSSNTFYSKGGMLFVPMLSILRIFYSQMLDTSNSIARFNGSGQNQLYEDFGETLLKLKLSYFNFLSTINQYGRALDKLGVRLPHWLEVKFYRNKIIEHWDCYAQYILGSPLSSQGTIGKIQIPYHSTMNFITPHGNKALSTLKKEFTKTKHRTLISQHIIDNKQYSDKIFKALKRIDPQLSTGKTQKIPEDLIRALFNYSFPSPILDVEKYSNDLVRYLINIPYKNTWH